MSDRRCEIQREPPPSLQRTRSPKCSCFGNLISVASFINRFPYSQAPVERSRNPNKHVCFLHVCCELFALFCVSVQTLLPTRISLLYFCTSCTDLLLIEIALATHGRGGAPTWSDCTLGGGSKLQLQTFSQKLLKFLCLPSRNKRGRRTKANQVLTEF